MFYRYLILFNLLILASSFSGYYNGAMVVSKWKYEIPLVISASLIDGSTDFTNMPYYVNLSSLGTHFWENVKPDGSDIRIFTSPYPSTSELPVHVIAISDGGSSGTGTLYTKITVDDASSTTVYIRYGNPSATSYSASDTYGRYNVWSTLVDGWGLTESSGTFASLVSGGRTYDVGAGVSSATGKLEKSCPRKNASGNFGSNGDPMDLSSSGTVCGWVKFDDWNTNNSGSVPYLFGSQTAATNGTNKFDLSFNNGSATTIRVRTTTNNNATSSSQQWSASDDDQWTFAAFSHSSGTWTCYKNGSSFSMADSGTHSTTSGSTEDTAIGRTCHGADMDLILYFSSTLIDNHIWALYRNQGSPSTYHSIGSARALWRPQIVQ